MGRLIETDLRIRASKLFYVGEMARLECLGHLVDFLKTLFKSVGMMDKVNFADVSDLMIRGVHSSVRPVVAISYPADDPQLGETCCSH